MIRHNLRIAWRNILKYKLQNTVSIISLTVGMVCFALSALWLRYENSYDTWWPEHDNVYLLQYSNGIGYYQEHGYGNVMPYPYGERVAQKVPEIKLLARVIQGGGANLKQSNESEESVWGTYLMIDENAQEMLDIKVIEGEKKLTLGPDDIALTRSTAERLFPDGNALGQKVWIDINDESQYLNVVAIVEDCRKPTSFPYDYLRAVSKIYLNDAIYATATFVRVDSENVAKVAKALEKDVMKHVENDTSWETVQSYKLLPLSQLRDKTDFVDKVVQLNHLQLFIILGVIVICCALFNYFTMLVTRIRIRQHELALRYVHGATTSSLITLIATELILILVVATCFAVGIVCLTLDDFKNICCIYESQTFFIAWFLFFACLVALVSVAVTTVIVYFCNRRQLAQALGKCKMPKRRRPLGGAHGALVIGQIAVSIGAVFCSFMMMNQVNYLFSSPDMGFAKHNRGTIYINLQFSEDEDTGGEHYCEMLAQELKKWPEIEDFIMGYDYPIPDGFQHTTDITTDGGETHQVLMVDADENFNRLMELQLVDGEFITSQDDPSFVCINESAARLLGEQGKVGGWVKRSSFPNEYVVKGIVKDLSYMSPTTPTQPMIFIQYKNRLKYTYWISIPIHWKEGTDWDKLSEKVEGLKQSLYADEAKVGYISMCVAERAYNRYLQSERTLCSLLMLVTFVCILIALFGILGMITLACERRRKEVALRKIHGASLWRIFRLFLDEYMSLLIIAGIIAFPVGYYLMHQWLMQYVKQAPIPLWLYPAILAVMALLIFLTVFWQIWKVAKAEPDVVLKSE